MSTNCPGGGASVATHGPDRAFGSGTPRSDAARSAPRAELPAHTPNPSLRPFVTLRVCPSRDVYYAPRAWPPPHEARPPSLRIRDVRAHLPDRLVSRVPDGIRRIDRGDRCGARHFHRRPRAGGLVLGGRADRHAGRCCFTGSSRCSSPILAAITPALLWLVRLAYIGLGRNAELGLFGGTAVRLVLSRSGARRADVSHGRHASRRCAGRRGR